MVHTIMSVHLQSLEASSLSSLSGLRELHLEENRLKDLSHFSPLPCLQRLYLGSNKIQVLYTPLYRIVHTYCKCKLAYAYLGYNLMPSLLCTCRSSVN